MGITSAAAEYGSMLGDEALTVSSTAVALTPTASSLAAMVTNGANAVRVRWGTPTASVGHYLNPYSVLELFGDDLTDVKFIRVSSDSTVHVTYFG
jgi:hypothetical protein